MRIDVAVGTLSDRSMFLAVAAGMPRRVVYVGSSVAAAGAAGLASLATGVLVPLAGSAASLAGRGLAVGSAAGFSACGGLRGGRVGRGPSPAAGRLRAPTRGGRGGGLRGRLRRGLHRAAAGRSCRTPLLAPLVELPPK